MAPISPGARHFEQFLPGALGRTHNRTRFGLAVASELAKAHDGTLKLGVRPNGLNPLSLQGLRRGAVGTVVA
jgi:hypothetical protein